MILLMEWERKKERFHFLALRKDVNGPLKDIHIYSACILCHSQSWNKKLPLSHSLSLSSSSALNHAACIIWSLVRSLATRDKGKCCALKTMQLYPASRCLQNNGTLILLLFINFTEQMMQILSNETIENAEWTCDTGTRRRSERLHHSPSLIRMIILALSLGRFVSLSS